MLSNDDISYINICYVWLLWGWSLSRWQNILEDLFGPGPSSIPLTMYNNAMKHPLISAPIQAQGVVFVCAQMHVLSRNTCTLACFLSLHRISMLDLLCTCQLLATMFSYPDSLNKVTILCTWYMLPIIGGMFCRGGNVALILKVNMYSSK